MEITTLAGGIGASKLLLGLHGAMDPREITVIVNTGDDIILHKTLMMSYHVDGDQTHFGPTLEYAAIWAALTAVTYAALALLRSRTSEMISNPPCRATMSSSPMRQ